MSFLQELKRRNVVRVGAAYVIVGWLLVQAAEILFGSFDAPDWVLQVLIVVLCLGLVPVLVFSWVYELTPDGVKRETEIDRAQSTTGVTGQRLNTIIIASLGLAVAVLLGDRILQNEPADGLAADAGLAGPDAASPPVPEPEKSIAVLPFVAMSTSEDDEFFADGLSEELLNVLAGIEGLKVAGRTSSFYYKGRNEDLREIANSLGVANILEGSVRRSGEKIRVTAQLIEAESGFHLWSETFDRPQGDIFHIQDEISGHVAAALRTRIMGDEIVVTASETVNPEAQNQFLIARAALAQRNMPDTRRARDLYAQAAVLDPANPRYLAGYAMSVVLLYWNHRDISADEAIYEAGTAIEKAMDLREPSADTLAVAGLVEELRAMTASDPNAKERALDLYQQALEKDAGNILALQWLASIYLDINKPQLARVNFEKVVALDPLNTLALTGLANAYDALGQYDAARNHLYKLAGLFPELSNVYGYLAGLEWRHGRLDRSTVWVRKAQSVDQDSLSNWFLVSNYVIFGWADEALEAAEQYRLLSDTDISRLIQARLDLEHEAIIDESTRLFAMTGESDFAVISAWSHAITDDCKSAVGILERQYPSLQAEVINYLATEDVMDAVLLAWCYDRAMNANQSRRLIAALLDSDTLSADAMNARPDLKLHRIAALSVVGRTDEAITMLEGLDVAEMPVALTKLGLPVDSVPVFDALYETAAFKQYAEQGRYRIAQQARNLDSGAAREELVAEIRAAGYSFDP